MHQQGYNFFLIRIFFPSNIEFIPATIYLIKACFESCFKLGLGKDGKALPREIILYKYGKLFRKTYFMIYFKRKKVDKKYFFCLTISLWFSFRIIFSLTVVVKLFWLSFVIILRHSNSAGIEHGTLINQSPIKFLCVSMIWLGKEEV